MHLSPQSMARVRTIAACLLLVGLCWLAFGGALDCGFVRLDDHGYVYENSVVSAGLTKVGLRWALTTKYMFNWHPLTWFSHMADAELYGLEPAGHHLTSLLIHMANALLLFIALRSLTGRFYLPLLAAALWAVHPLRVESVVWISERKDLLSSFFGLSALWAYAAIKGRRGMLGTVVLFALALMAKPIWVTFPFLLLLLDFWPLRRWPGTPARTLVMEKLPLFLLSAFSCVITYSVQQSGGAVASLQGIPLVPRLANAVMAYGAYLRMLVWPVDLAVYYPYPLGPVSLWLLGGTGILLIGLTALAVATVRRQPWNLVGWLWFAGALVPMIGLVQVGGQAWADRYMYLPQIGLVMALVWTGAELLRFRRTGFALALVLAVGLAFLSRAQTRTWKDTETLFLTALERTEDNVNIQFNLANWYQLNGRRDQALEHYRETLAMMPDDSGVMNNLAVSLVSGPVASSEEAEEALGLATRLVEMSPVPNLSFINTLAMAQAASGDYAAAVETAREALALAEQSGNKKLRDKIYYRLGRYELELRKQGR